MGKIYCMMGKSSQERYAVSEGSGATAADTQGSAVYDQTDSGRRARRSGISFRG